VPTRAVFLLDEDPELADRMDPEQREIARRLIRARVFRVDKGVWEPPAIDHGTIGLLLLEGLMMRRVGLGRVASAELIGAGDIIRPWDELQFSMLEAEDTWRVLDPARVVLLDGEVTAMIGRWPELTVGVAERLMRRTRYLTLMMAANHFVMVEQRLLAVLWHIASLWGRMTPEGIVIPYRLTHEVLADMVGAQRPSVTTALGKLERDGRLERRSDRCFVLLGDQPSFAREAVVTNHRET
jgi:CRP-like cAMP-binding protein